MPEVHIPALPANVRVCRGTDTLGVDRPPTWFPDFYAALQSRAQINGHEAAFTPSGWRAVTRALGRAPMILDHGRRFVDRTTGRMFIVTWHPDSRDASFLAAVSAASLLLFNYL